MIRVIVAYACPEQQWLWTVELPPQATVQQALAAARAQALASDRVPWEAAPVAIFGEIATREAIVRDGDRVELLRPLLVDPKESRRARAQRLRAPKAAAKG